VLRVAYLIYIECRGDLANHHTSSALDTKTYGLVFRFNQVS